MKTSKKVQFNFNTEVWKEGNLFVAYVPQLDLSSCGETIEKAKRNVKEATELFIEEAEKKGTLHQILDEAGFSFNQGWQAPEMVSYEKMQLAF